MPAMPAPSDNVNRFIASFMQAVNGCGVITNASRDDRTRITHATHLDGCQVDIPDEAIVAMSAEQLSTAFPSNMLRPTFAALRTGADVPAPASTPVPDLEVPVNQARAEQAIGDLTRFASRIANSRDGGSLGIPSTSRSSTPRTHSDRGGRFRRLLGYAGVTLPELMDSVIGKVLNEMYADWEDRLRRSQNQLDRVQNDYQAAGRDWNRRVETAVSDAQGARTELARMEKLRKAAVAWRDSTGTAKEKFALFEALLLAVDTTSADTQPAPDLGTAPPMTLDISEAVGTATTSAPAGGRVTVDF